MRIGAIPIVTVLSLGFCVACAQTNPSWTQLSLSTCDVDKFLAEHPESDGRGVVVAVFDTGVDPSIPGLTLLPDGGVKVIDVQDFSGQGDVDLHRVNVEEGKLVDFDDDGAPLYYELPTLPADNGEARRFWFGVLDEYRFICSGVPDLDDNGSTEDEWTIMVTALEGDGDDQALFFIDRNGDRSFADEQPLRNYHLEFDQFTLYRERPEEQIVPLNFQVNIFLRKAQVVIHWDDGAHGTHVAGLAAGYRINNQDGLNGTAPGAYLMSCKIGNGVYGSPTTTESVKKSFEHVARYAREHQVHVVVNMSFGVESVIEGHSDIDKWVDEYLVENPYVTFCTSAGNEGPGLSSVGTPSAAYHCICVAAMMAADTGRDVAAYEQDAAAVTGFSSRGGELAKPDVAVPGWSTSTVPRHVTRGDFWAGTSMAAPYAAGLCATLISDQLSQDPKAKVRGWYVRRALELSGTPTEGLNELDYGWGTPNLPRAKKLLDALMKRAGDDPIIGYKISTDCPSAYKGKARAAYWRGEWFPTGDDMQRFTISPIFIPTADANERTQFTRKYELRSNVDWISTPQESIYLRSEQSASVKVAYDGEKLKEPGVYVGTIDAIHDGMVEFRLLNTIVVPHRFSVHGDYTVKLENQTVNGWAPERIFLAVPPGASTMRLTMSAPEGETSKARFDYVFDPTGHGHRKRGGTLNPDGGLREVVRTFSDKLRAGVWEAPIVANYPGKTWPFNFEAKFFGLHAEPAKITEWSGGKGELFVTNQFTKRVVANCDGKLEGYREHHEDKFEGLQDTLEYSINVGEGFNRVRLHLEMTPEAYATTTDIAVILKDESGEALYSSGFSNRIVEKTVSVKGSLSLEITGGFTWADDKRETPITVDIDKLLTNAMDIKVGRNGSSPVNFVPGLSIPIEFKLSGKQEYKPKGAQPVGYLRFRERHANDEVLRVPLDIGG